jgi:MYXO-CTERM domain-containing protein
VCDDCVATPDAKQTANSCGDTWSASTAGYQPDPGVTNNVGQVIGAVCDPTCTPTTSSEKSITVGLTPTTSSQKSGSSTSGSTGDSGGGVQCSVHQPGESGAPGGMLLLGLGVVSLAASRRRWAK